MKSVLISIQPKWCELIASGKKTIEVRKTKPKIDTPFKCYIYMTKDKWYKDYKNKNHYGNGKVIGEFVCDCIANYEAELWDDETYERIQEFFEPDDFAEYGEYEYKTIADNGDDFWRENMLCESSCVTIEELRKYVGTGIATFYGWHISDLVIYDKSKELGEFFKIGHSEYCKSEWEERERLRTHLEKHNEITGDKAHLNTDSDFENILKMLSPFKMKRPPQSWCYVEGVEGI